MWILKNSKELLEHLKSPTFNHVASIKYFDFSMLYTTIPRQKLKTRLTTIIRNAFIFKNDNHRQIFGIRVRGNIFCELIRVLWRWDHQHAWVLVDNNFVVFAGKLPADSWHSNGYKLCLSSHRHLFCIYTGHLYDAEFIQSLLSTRKKQTASRFNFTYRYIDDVLPIKTKKSKMIWARCIMLNLKSRTPQRDSLLLLT